MLENAMEKAAKQLGYTLRQRQKDIVRAFVRGRDVFVSLPTGSGKSLCYFILLLTYDILRETSRNHGIRLNFH